MYYLLLIIYFIFMPVICWGPLAKSAQDPTTIPDYIASKILDHNVNPSAHGLDGYAVFNHRDSAVLDHIDGSVLLEKLAVNKRIIISAFESLDSWNIEAGNVTNALGKLYVATGQLTDDYGCVYTSPGYWVPLDWNKNIFWQTTVQMHETTLQEIFFGVGGTALIDEMAGFGFKVENGNLYCYHYEYSAGSFVYTTFQITDITITNWNVYRAMYDATAGTLKFYVNGDLKKTFDSGLPTTNSSSLFVYQVQTKTDVARSIAASDLLFSIDR